MCYHQVLMLGIDRVESTIEYTIEDECFVIRSIEALGEPIPVGIFSEDALLDIEGMLAEGHAQVVQDFDDDIRINNYLCGLGA